jgi:hypothetical protein
MAASASRKRTILALVLAGSLVGAAVALPALAATSTKFYTPSINPNTSVAAGVSRPYTFTIANDSSSTQAFGSANITIPGFTGVTLSQPTPTTSAGKTWTAAVNTTTIMLRNPGPGPTNRLTPGQSVTVAFNATAPCTAGSKTWTTRVKQSNDFSGTGNDFTRSTATDPVVLVTGACSTGAASIFYVTGPSNTTAGGTMATVEAKVIDNNGDPVSGDSVTLSSSDPNISGTLTASTAVGTGVATFSNVQVGTLAGSYTLTATEANASNSVSAPFNVTPGSPATIQFTGQPSVTQVNDPITPDVQVTVTDANHNGVPGISVSMAIGAGPGALNGPGPQTTDNTGMATFAGLSIDQSSSNYTLVATAGSLSATSDPFVITSISVPCDGGPCQTGTITSGASSVSVNADGGFGTLSVTFESVPLDCGPDFGGVGATITIAPPQGSPPPPSITVIFDDTINPPFQNSYPVCKNVEDENGNQIGDPHTVPFCSDNGGVLPCISQQEIRFHGDQPPTLHTVMLITQTDPKSLH